MAPTSLSNYLKQRMLTLDTTESSGLFVPSVLLCLQKEWETRHGHWELWNYSRTKNGSKGQSTGKCRCQGENVIFPSQLVKVEKFLREIMTLICASAFFFTEEAPPLIKRGTHNLLQQPLRRKSKGLKQNSGPAPPSCECPKACIHCIQSIRRASCSSSLTEY